MALKCHMTIEGSVSGEIKGTSDKKDREESHEIWSVNHDVTMPYNQQTGEPVGHVQHHALTVLKKVDEASPVLYGALVNNESLTVELMWYRPLKGKAEAEHFFTTKLENALLVSISPYMPDMSGGAGNAAEPMEQLSFVYNKITWTEQTNGTETIDEWTGH